MIRIVSDYSDVERELDRLAGMPDLRMSRGLDAVLTLGFEQALARVHVHTGALKGSGQKKSSTTKHTWRGEFSFGAPAAGIDYAVYEKSRGDSHDFMSQTVALKALFKAALLRGLRRR